VARKTRAPLSPFRGRDHGSVLPAQRGLGGLMEKMWRTRGGGGRGWHLAAFLGLTALVLLSVFLAARHAARRRAAMDLERGVKVLAEVQAETVRALLARASQDLLFLAQRGGTDAEVRSFLAAHSGHGAGGYREAAYVPVNGEPAVLFVDTGKSVSRVSGEQAREVVNSPALVPGQGFFPGQPFDVLPGKYSGQDPDSASGAATGARAGEVILTGFAEPSYPAGIFPETAETLNFGVVRLTTPKEDGQGRILGYWVLSVDGQAIRNIFSVHNSIRSRLAGLIPGSRAFLSFFLDGQGWVLMESGESEDAGGQSTAASAGRDSPGVPGRPGFPGAFRPSGARESFWRVLKDIRAGQSGTLAVNEGLGLDAGGPGRRVLGFAPVVFKGREDGPEMVVAGVAVMSAFQEAEAGYALSNRAFLALSVAALSLAGILALLLSRAEPGSAREPAPEVQAGAGLREEPGESAPVDRHEPAPAGTIASPEGLNERQLRGLAYLREHGSMSRSDYQAVAGESVPSRTAQHDLRDLVGRGLLSVRGRGPATRYVPAGEDGAARAE